MNRVALLLNVHKRQEVPSQLKKIEHIMQKKIRESRQFKPDNVDSRRFETSFICKINYTIYIVIEIFKEDSPKGHVACCTCVKQPCISPRRK